jgi:large subunit ribosomal protein L3
MGGERVTVQKLKVVSVNADKNLLLVKGAVPGPRGGLLMVKKSVKAG